MKLRPSDGRRVLASLLGLSALYGNPVAAQTLELPIPPSRSMVDSRNVDLMSGEIALTVPVLDIGNGENKLSHTLYWMSQGGFRHGHVISIAIDDFYQTGTHVTIAFGKESSGFTLDGTNYVSDKGDGATLTFSSDKWTYTDRDGTVIEFDRTYGSNTLYSNSINYYGSADGVATLIARPDGHKTRLAYKNESYYYSSSNFSGTIYSVRLQSVTSSSGYQLKFGYLTNALSQATANDWLTFAQASTINNSVDYCDPAADSCTSLSQAWPTATFSTTPSGTDSIFGVTDPLGRTTSYVSDNLGRLTGIRRPSASSNTLSYGYSQNTFAINSVTVDGVGTWNYNSVLNLSTMTLTGSVTTPTISTPMSFTANYNSRQPLTITDENGRTTTSTYDGFGRVQTVTLPGSGSNYSTYGYDARGNLVSMVVTPKSGSGLAALSTYASYPASCTIAATCNKPVTTTNSAGKVTNYFYNANGTPDYVQAPAPISGGPRPEVHYSYANVQATVKDASGTEVPQGDVVSMPSGTTTCLTGAWPCAPSDQVVTQIAYTGTPAKNLLPSSITAGSGTGAPSSTTSFAYDSIGNRTTVTDPLGNATKATYASDRQPLTTVGTGVDSSPTSRRPGTVTQYNSDGLVSSVAYGSVNPDGSAFTANQTELTDYDTANRRVKVRVSDGTSDVAVVQQSYDGAGRAECTAQRMNPATFGSLPASACSLGTAGSFGQDRISRTVYDPAGQVVQRQEAYGVAGTQANESYTYTTHGKLETATDANGNVTAYAYDGHDRLLRTCYTSTAGACQAGSASDYEQLTYGDNVNVTAMRLRDGTTTSLTYDNLNRVTSRTPSGEPAVNFGYNLLGMHTSVQRPSDGVNLTTTYDALGRRLSETQPNGTVSYQYDAASNLTRLTWGDGLYVTYDYNPSRAVTAIRENGATSGIGVLATYSYDSLGRRSAASFGNGTSRTYAYGSIGRLAGIRIDLAGTTSDQVIGAVGGVGTAIAYNPASQMTSIAHSNDAYAFTGRSNANVGYTANGLNQYTLAGSTSQGYDARGNLTASGSTAFTYNRLNQLTGGNGTTLSYDGAGRLLTYGVGASTSRFYYAGPSLIAEVASAGGAILKRYVPGPEEDEIVVWYEGAGTTSRRWLQADERGSIVAVSDASGAAIGINKYDEYGMPLASNLGRFGYTGQVWLNELGLHHYKARMYSFSLGRFMQTDPIGYADGMNWYAYVGNDPVNRRDPSGLGDFINGEIVVNASRGGSFDFGGALTSSYNFHAELAAYLQAVTVALYNAAVQQAGGRQTQNVSAQSPTTFCDNPTYGRENPYFPNGRINTGKMGNRVTAGIDLNAIAAMNGIEPPANINNPIGTTRAAMRSPTPVPVGFGWTLHRNPSSGQYVFANRGLRLRWDSNRSVVRLDIPQGFLVPGVSGPLAATETCHYRP